MKSKAVLPRTRAWRDAEEAADYYLSVAGESVALSFTVALDQAYVRVARHPAAGSPRYAHLLSLSGLRSWPLRSFPYLIFYFEQSDHIDVWRVLNMARDSPQLLGLPEVV